MRPAKLRFSASLTLSRNRDGALPPCSVCEADEDDEDDEVNCRSPPLVRSTVRSVTGNTAQLVHLASSDASSTSARRIRSSQRETGDRCPSHWWASTGLGSHVHAMTADRGLQSMQRRPSPVAPSGGSGTPSVVLATHTGVLVATTASMGFAAEKSDVAGWSDTYDDSLSYNNLLPTSSSPRSFCPPPSAANAADVPAAAAAAAAAAESAAPCWPLCLSASSTKRKGWTGSVGSSLRWSSRSTKRKS